MELRLDSAYLPSAKINSIYSVGAGNSAFEGPGRGLRVGGGKERLINTDLA